MIRIDKDGNRTARWLSWLVKRRGRELTFMPVEAMNEYGRRGWGWGENVLVRWDNNWPGIARSNRTEGYEMVKKAIEPIVEACPCAIQDCSPRFRWVFIFGGTELGPQSLIIS